MKSATWAKDASGNYQVTFSGNGAEDLTATFITKTPDDALVNEQALSVLATGVLKSTTVTGVLSIAAASDLPGYGSVFGNVKTAPSDGSLAASQFKVWIDDTNGSPILMIKAKQADGTVVTGGVPLAA